MSKFIDEIFNFVLFLQFLFLMVFLALNLENLDSITYSIDIDTYNYEFTVNLYYASAIVIIVFVVIIILDLAFPTLHEEGTRNISKIVGYFMLYTTLSTGFNYYIQDLNTIGTIIMFFVGIIYFMKAISSSSKMDSVE